MTESVYDFICSIGELIDKLSIENIKCYHVNTMVLTERKKDNPDHVLISSCEAKARTAGEQRVRLRNEIDKRLSEAITRGSIGAAADVRTYTVEKS